MVYSEDAREVAILKLIGSLLADVTESNCDLRRESPTVFDAVSCPDMSVYSYLARIRKYTKFDVECFPIALIYLMRLRSVGPMFAVTPHNVHRMLITALLLASKASDDVYHTNSFMAQCGGIRVQEINILEIEMCTRLRWKMQVDATELEGVQCSLRSQQADLREVMLNTPAVGFPAKPLPAEPPAEPAHTRRTPSTPAALGAAWSYWRGGDDSGESAVRAESLERDCSPRCVIGGSEVGSCEASGEVSSADLADLPSCKRSHSAVSSISRPSSFGQGLNLLAGKLHRTQWSRWVPSHIRPVP